MTQLLCKFIGHRDFDTRVLAARPWEDPDIGGYSLIDFREPNCLRCGQPLKDLAA